MGTIGHRTLLHQLRNWQIRAAIRGYFRAQRPGWEQVRQHAWYILAALGSSDLKKPSDLMKFPWEGKTIGETDSDTTQEDIEELQQVMREMNRHH